MRLSTFSRKIQKEVSPHLGLVKGEGYVYDDDELYGSETVVYIFRFSDTVSDRWFEDAHGFFAKVSGETT